MLQATLAQPVENQASSPASLLIGALRAMLLLAFMSQVPAFTTPMAHAPLQSSASGPGCGIAWAP